MTTVAPCPPLQVHSTDLLQDGRAWWFSISGAIRQHAQHDHLQGDQYLLAADHALWKLDQARSPESYREFVEGAACEVQDSISRLCAKRLPGAHSASKFDSPRLLVLPASGQGARGRTWLLNCLHAHYACALVDDPACEDRLEAASDLVAQAILLTDVRSLDDFITGAMKEAEEHVAKLRATCEQHPGRAGRWTAR